MANNLTLPANQKLIPWELDRELRKKRFLNPVQFDLELANLLAAGATPEDAADWLAIPVEFILFLLGTPRFSSLVGRIQDELEALISEEDAGELLERQKRANFVSLAVIRDSKGTPTKERLTAIKLMLENTPSIQRAGLEGEVLRFAFTKELEERFREGWRRASPEQAGPEPIEASFSPIFSIPPAPLPPEQGGTGESSQEEGEGGGERKR